MIRFRKFISPLETLASLAEIRLRSWTSGNTQIPSCYSYPRMYKNLNIISLHFVSVALFDENLSCFILPHKYLFL